MRDNPGGCCSSMDSEVDVESPPGQFIGGKIESYLHSSDFFILGRSID